MKWQVPTISVWVGLLALCFWLFVSGVGGWPVVAVLTAVVLLRFAYGPRQLGPAEQLRRGIGEQ